MKSIYSQAWKRIVITFDDETCEPIDLAILAASGPMQGWELEFTA
jgi:hypothetical protein